MFSVNMHNGFHSKYSCEEQKKAYKPHKYRIVKDSTNNYSQNVTFAYSWSDNGVGV